MFFASAIVAAFAIGNVLAGDCCCTGDEGTAPAATAEKETKTAAQDDQVQSTQPSTQVRSYSYEPTYRNSNRGKINGFYAGTIDQDPRIIGSYGHRPASDKNLGNY